MLQDNLSVNGRNKIKCDMSELWKEIFHDSDSYLSIVINDDLNLDLCAWRYNSAGVLTSMIIGIPYNFKHGNMPLSSLYLCGVSTKKEMRGKGEIQQLMCEIEKKAIDNNLDFLFLIPANEKLRKYYTKYNYQNLILSTKEHKYYIGNILQYNCCKFCNLDTKFKIDNSIEKSYYLKSENLLIVGVDLIEYLQKIEERSGDCFLQHTYRQWLTVFREWIISGNVMKMVGHLTDQSVLRSMDPIESCSADCEGLKSRMMDRINGEVVEVAGLILIRNEESFFDESVIGNYNSSESDLDESFNSADFPRPYGMIKKLTDRTPDPSVIGFTFMLD